MATYEESSDCDSQTEFSDTDTDSDDSNSDNWDQGLTNQQVCEYYNKGHCRNGARCQNLHVCKYFLKGLCRHGSSCRLSHTKNAEQGHHEGRRQGRGRGSWNRSCSSDSDTDSSKSYRWQLDLGNGWEDVNHDHILEAQYSRPNTKGIKIFNTHCGALSIDFTKMSILKKTNLKVRRKGSRNTEWLWYYRGNHGWCLFRKNDPQGKTSSISSSSLEVDFQRNKSGIVQFTVDSTSYEIRFQEMMQKNLSTGHKRKIRRRPKYVSPEKKSVRKLTEDLKSIWPSSSNQTPMWQFSGKGGNWHNFKPRGCCSVSSTDIEAEYQRNSKGSMSFTVNGDQYILDFAQMIQTNQSTSNVRRVRRVHE